MRLSVASCSLLALMWSHTLEVTCARVIGPLPTTPSSAGESVTGLFSALFLAAIKINPFLSLLDSETTPRRRLPTLDRLHRCGHRSRSRPQQRSHALALPRASRRGWRRA